MLFRIFQTSRFRGPFHRSSRAKLASVCNSWTEMELLKKKKKKEDIFEPISTRLRTFAGPSNRWVIPAISARHRLARRDTYWRAWRPANHFEYLFVKFHDKKNSLIKIMPLDERTMGFIVIHTSFKKQIQRQNKKKKKRREKNREKRKKASPSVNAKKY